MVKYKIDMRGGGSKNRSLGQTHVFLCNDPTPYIAIRTERCNHKLNCSPMVQMKGAYIALQHGNFLENDF